jgi:hypothetical protein
MDGDDADATRDTEESAAVSRRLRLRYALLTAALFAPLVWSFLAVRNLYPFPAYTMMMGGGDPTKGTDYYVLRGETNAGDTFDLAPAELTDALSWRHWSLVAAAVENKSFQIANPHPANAALAAEAGGVDKLPRAARLDELLRAWGECYNRRLPEGSPRRLRAVVLDAYRWDGRSYEDRGRRVESWRAGL